jgi:hypothetical protein
MRYRIDAALLDVPGRVDRCKLECVIGFNFHREEVPWAYRIQVQEDNSVRQIDFGLLQARTKRFMILIPAIDWPAFRSSP